MVITIVMVLHYTNGPCTWSPGCTWSWIITAVVVHYSNGHHYSNSGALQQWSMYMEPWLYLELDHYSNGLTYNCKIICGYILQFVYIGQDPDPFVFLLMKQTDDVTNCSKEGC
jgi:hypothetical protein